MSGPRLDSHPVGLSAQGFRLIRGHGGSVPKLAGVVVSPSVERSIRLHRSREAPGSRCGIRVGRGSNETTARRQAAPSALEFTDSVSDPEGIPPGGLIIRLLQIPPAFHLLVVADR